MQSQTRCEAVIVKLLYKVIANETLQLNTQYKFSVRFLNISCFSTDQLVE